MHAHIAFMETTIRHALEAIRGVSRTSGVIEKEGRGNFVTQVDLACERVIVDAIRASFPHDAILSEETPSDLSDPLSLPALWIIDPIDGTNNLRYDRNYSAIAIGYAEHGRVMAAAVYDLGRQMLYTASRGEGAQCNGEAISVARETDLGRSTVATDSSSSPEHTRHNLELLLKITPTPWSLIKGSAVLAMCDVACGRMDLYFQSTLHPWDNAAAFLIAEEAGAAVLNHKGEATDFMQPDVIVANPTLAAQCARSFRE